ncbi:MAG: DNA mismatch repair protein MutS [Opitutales bacterium]|nr:DNA mismatch repair protein MutS [Opitutales bacterium]MBP3358591.1 DNA mismatch repair protein MutS [Opitutales bacterium]
MAKSEKKGEKITPMMEQYWSIRNTLASDTLLLFRLGDFYEMFYEDAVEGSRILGITLTKRQNYPMAGIPYHAADQYIPKILQAGKKVAICDQNEIPKPGQLVKRSLTRILTAGTTIEDSQLDSKSGNFTMAIDIDSSRKLFASWLDLSTAEFYCAEFEKPEDFLPILSAFNPKEIILPEDASRRWAENASLATWYAMFRSVIDITPVTLLHDYRFEPSWGSAQIQDTLGVLTLEGFGIERNSRLTGPAGALIFYATENLRQRPQNLRTLRRFSGKKCVLIDPATQRNLEIFHSTTGSREGSLISVIDRTRTHAGARLLETYLSTPSLDVDEIFRRQNIVWELYSAPTECSHLEDKLSQVRDIPRILSRLQNRVRNPRELLALQITIEQFEPIKKELKNVGGRLCSKLADEIGDFSEPLQLLQNALSDDVPSKIQEGGVIRQGFDEELDRLRSLSSDNMTWLAELEQSEQKRTGIKNLRIKYNGAFGYFIEVTKSYLDLVPPEYIRKQTMTNAERFTTEDLRTKEREILHAEELSKQREEELFQWLVENLLQYSDALADVSAILSQVDVFRGWAELSREWDYCKPTIDESDTIEIFDGRHPVVEQMLRRDRIGLARSESFVPNDTFLSSTSEQIALITGPNMAGKSTYIRQIALIALMAQIGCFVPAKKCTMGIVDRIFSRVGASDELSRGNSTFMVEMNETANILNNATDRSLIILDEIGRGTSTYDGLSIAWAVVEFIHGGGSKGPKTLFATHYHEITKLDDALPRLANYRVCVKEWNDEIIFVRKIEKGAADKSYGIQVARLAGLPQKVIDRAKQVLSELESEGGSIAVNLGAVSRPKQKRKEKNNPDGESNFKQLSLF